MLPRRGNRTCQRQQRLGEVRVRTDESQGQRSRLVSDRQSRCRCESGDRPASRHCRSRHAVGPTVVVTVDLSALLLFWRGYADMAQEAGPAPRFEARERSLVQNLKSPLVARCGVVLPEAGIARVPMQCRQQARPALTSGLRDKQPPGARANRLARAIAERTLGGHRRHLTAQGSPNMCEPAGWR